MENNSKTKSKVGIIIPTLNEEKSIGKVIEDVKKNLGFFNHEVIVVDGRSKDNTVPIAKKLGANVIFQKTKGYGEALYAGYFFASTELNCNILVTMDADGTYSAKDCVNVIKKIESNDADYVVGKRLVNSKNMTTSHRFGNRSISWLIRNLLKIKIPDTQSGLFAFRSYLIDNIDLKQSGWAVNTEMLTKASDLGMLIDSIDISYSSRIGETKGSTIKGGLINLQVILRMVRDFNPLLFQGTMGVCLIVVGLYFGIIVLLDFLETGFVNRPNLAVLAALLILAGIQIFSLGLVADLIKKKQQVRIRQANNLYSKT